MDELTCFVCQSPVLDNATVCGTCGERVEQVVSEDEGTDPGSAPPARADSDPFASASLAVALVVSGSRDERTIELQTGDRLVIGRETGPLTDLCSDNISADHAEITVGADCVEVRDTGRDHLGSTNGTYLDGERLPPNVGTRLMDGSVITCGTDPPLTIRVSVGKR